MNARLKHLTLQSQVKVICKNGIEYDAIVEDVTENAVTLTVTGGAPWQSMQPEQTADISQFTIVPAHHLVGQFDLTALANDIFENGLKTPLEVEVLPDGKFHVIHGLRRYVALCAIKANKEGEHITREVKYVII